MICSLNKIMDIDNVSIWEVVPLNIYIKLLCYCLFNFVSSHMLSCMNKKKKIFKILKIIIFHFTNNHKINKRLMSNTSLISSFIFIILCMQVFLLHFLWISFTHNFVLFTLCTCFPYLCIVSRILLFLI